jgi:integrase
MAYLAGRTKNDGCWKYASGFKTVHQARVRYFTWTEARKIIASARPDLRNLVLAALYTGARLSEILDIRSADLMEKRMAVYIKPQKTYRGRTVALPQEGYDFLKSLSRDKGTNDRLFTRYDGGLFTTSYVAAHFRKLMDKLGFSRENVYHCLRHTYASLLIQAGTPPIVVARQLGHLNMQTVIKHYAHVSDDFYDVELRSKFNPQFLTPGLFD